MPWVVLSSFLLTEVVAYPAFCWALLALTHAVARKSWRTGPAGPRRDRRRRARADAVRRAAGRASSSRSSSRRCSTRRRAALRRTSGARGAPSSSSSARLLLVVLVAIAIGKGSQLLGSYSVTAENVRLDFGLVRLAFEHMALLALGFAILPFIVGAGWLVDRLRPSTPGRERAFAVVGCDGAAARDAAGRLVQPALRGRAREGPLPLLRRPDRALGLAAALGSRQWPRWWALVVPTAGRRDRVRVGAARRCTRSSTSTRRSRS